MPRGGIKNPTHRPPGYQPSATLSGQAREQRKFAQWRQSLYKVFTMNQGT